MAEEKRRMRRSPPPGVNFKWTSESPPETMIVEIPGPKGSLYEQDIFEVELTFPEEFPEKPPGAVMHTKILHPNISDGAICINCLRTGFNPAITIPQIIDEIQDALLHPNPDDPLDKPVATLYKDDFEQFKLLVSEQIMKNIAERAQKK